MELQQLRCFVALAETLNFKKAAERTFVSQPSLSRYIAQLEAEYNVTLFERGRPFTAVTLTPAGEFLLAKARVLLQEIQTVSDLLHQIGGAVEEQVFSVGLDTRLSMEQMPSYLHAFSKEGDVRLLCQVLTGDEISVQIRNGILDLGFVIHPTQRALAGLLCRKITDIPLVLEVHEELLEKWQTRDPCELLKQVRVSTLRHDTGINVHIASVLQAMKCTLPIHYCETLAMREVLIRMGKTVGILTGGFQSQDPNVVCLPIPKRYGTVSVFALMSRESPTITRLVHYVEQRFLPGECLCGEG